VYAANSFFEKIIDNGRKSAYTIYENENHSQNMIFKVWLRRLVPCSIAGKKIGKRRYKYAVVNGSEGRDEHHQEGGRKAGGSEVSGKSGICGGRLSDCCVGDGRKYHSQCKGIPGCDRKGYGEPDHGIRGLGVVWKEAGVGRGRKGKQRRKEKREQEREWNRKRSGSRRKKRK
jgi:hypothetical protein